jgi:uncharacterized protein YndB with AHSA1/START domain
MEVKIDAVVTRIFNAPRKLVWNAWTNPEHLMRWWGPKDYNLSYLQNRLQSWRKVSVLYAVSRWSGHVEYRHLFGDCTH